KNLHILQGGLPSWQAAGFGTQSGEAAPNAVPFVPDYAAEKVVFIEEMVLLAKHKTTHIADARAAERFAGSVPEPRAGVRSGSIPGSVNVPFGSLVKDGVYKPLDEIR